MELILKENIVLKVKLWRNLSNQINKEITTQIKGQKIVALTSTLVSTTSSTKIYINPEIEEFTQLTYGTDQHEEVMEIPSQDNANTNLQSRMIRNRITIQDLMAMQWESDYQVSDQSATATFVLFDGEAKKLLDTTASNLITLQKSNDLEAPPQLKNLCNLTLIFEVKLNEFNLKEGSQQYTVTKTFVPTKNTEQQHPLQQIKQEPTSPTLISSYEDHIPIKRLRRKKRYKFKTHFRKKTIHAKREQTTQKKVHTTHQFIRNMPSQ
ncbi:hypothetical protein Ahy_A02g009754 [Arachis hypogaea]|uniref:Replication factor A C-terminal domain-containing protein n=1 Tax=Arachis hypogaea TaxID=3818 RepID=A0A445EHW8_ARAHY|nr:hypothetical protein Ahy_A02g009754 [Arachis hypogaea]